jgi:hypothetical protein
MIPPSPPVCVAVADHDGRNRKRLRLRQLLWTSLTVLVTAWCCTFGVIPAILALMIAKHILVAILVMGLGVDARCQVEG